jgi:hypothetical protein
MGRPGVPADIRTLIRTLAQAYLRWGGPRIHGEVLKLGIDVCQGDRRKIHGAPPAAALADVAHVPAESP